MDQPDGPASVAAVARAPSAVDISERDKLLVIIGVLLAMFLAALDYTIVSPAIPTIGKALGDPAYISWIVAAYFVTSTAATPLYGKLADIHGRRIVINTAIAVFVIGSVLAALAPSMFWLIVARAIQGLGGGGLVALAQTVIGDLVPPRERARYSVYIAGTWAIASLLGPTVGGLIAQYLHWSWLFWINLPLAAIAVAMIDRTLPRVPWQRRDHRLDVIGAVLIVSATVTLMLGLTFGGAGAGFTAAHVLALFAAAVVLAGLFVWRMRTALQPLIPLEILSDRLVLAATGSVFFAMASFVSLTIFVPVYFETVLGLSTAQAGLALVGYTVGTVFGANSAARAMRAMPRYKVVPMAGLALAAGCLGVLAWQAPALGLWPFVVLITLVGIGAGTQFPVTLISVQNAVDPRDMGVATGLFGFVRSLGSAIGVAVIGAVAAAAGVAVGFGSHAAVGAMVDGAVFRPVFLAAMISVLCALATFALMEERPLRGRDEMRTREPAGK